jgi:hypothetical protein
MFLSLIYFYFIFFLFNDHILLRFQTYVKGSETAIKSGKIGKIQNEKKTNSNKNKFAELINKLLFHR